MSCRSGAAYARERTLNNACRPCERCPESQSSAAASCKQLQRISECGPRLAICAALSSSLRFSSSLSVPACSPFWISSYTSLSAYADRTVETVWFRMCAVDLAAWNQPPMPNGTGPVEAR